MTSTTVNPSFARALLGPLVGLADDDEAFAHYRYLDPNDEAQVREVIRRELVPYYRRWDPSSKQTAKVALSWALSLRRDWLERAYYSALPPFDAPDEPALFFEWLWSELFGDEDFRLADPEAYQVRDDGMATNLIKLAPEGPES